MPGRDAVCGVPFGVTGAIEEEAKIEADQGWAI